MVASAVIHASPAIKLAARAVMGSRAAAKRAPAFASHSRCSEAGSLSATMPAPARTSTAQPSASFEKAAVRISTLESRPPSKPRWNIEPKNGRKKKA